MIGTDARQANVDYFDTIRRANMNLFARARVPQRREDQMYICPTCNAQSGAGAPHGDGMPCPTAVERVEAEIDEKRAHTKLLIVQTKATEQNIRRALHTRD